MKLIEIYKEKIIPLFFAVITLVIIINSILSFYYVKGFSMFPLIYDKTLIINNKIAYGIRSNSKNKYLILWRTPQKGDAIIFKDPKNSKSAVKKVFAVPGETFVKKNEDTILINNIYFKIGKEKLMQIKNNKIPEGFYLVIGENDNISFDSRDYGFIHINNIYGKIIY